jgi:erythromycin esterase
MHPEARNDSERRIGIIQFLTVFTSTMRIRSIALVLSFVAVGGTACRSAPKTPPPPPPPLSDSAAAALQWVESHLTPFQPSDSVASPAERAALVAFANNARIIGFSELTEGTREYAYIIRRTLLALADSSRMRGLAIQASMADAMELDRYVRTGVGDPQRLLRALGSWRWETREVRALVEAMREYNRNRSAEQQVGFYGFEIPSAGHAVNVVTSLHDSVTGPSLKSWLARTYACVAINEGAQWGREGRSSDTSYWSACGPSTAAARDSVSALRRRVNAASRAAPDVAFAEQMAKLIAHHVRIGLRRLKREEFNMEHVLFLADLIGADNKLMLWGGDVEMARVTLDGTTVQTAVPLGARLGDRYRNVAFAFGTGVVRARSMASIPRGGGPPGLSDVTINPPLPNTFEDVFGRASRDGYWLDLRNPPADMGGTWLRGPRQMRLIIEAYSALQPEATQTPIEFPKNFDAVVVVKRVTPAKQ